MKKLEIESVKIKCNWCKKIWAYKGMNKVMATCPDCMKKVGISKNKISEEAYAKHVIAHPNRYTSSKKPKEETKQ